MAEDILTAVKIGNGLLGSLRRGALQCFSRKRPLVTYTVAITPERSLIDKRTTNRRRTRLRSGKILDANNRFLIECSIQDRSFDGIRLRLMKNTAIPAIFGFYDDESQIVVQAQTAWRRNEILGARILSKEPVRLNEKQRASLRNKFYAMPD